MIIGIDATEPAADPLLPAEEEVRGDVEHWHYGKVLIHGLYAKGLRGDGAAHVNLSSVDEDLACVRLQHTGEDLDQRRLASAIVTDEAQYLAREEVKIDLVQRLDVTERLRDASRLQDRRSGGGRHRPAATAYG